MSNQTDGRSHLCSELVSVLYEDSRRHTRSAVANLEAISADSATLLTDDQPKPGQAISFSAQGHDLYGTVESIEIDQTLGCFTKVKLDRESRWNARFFVPEHFLALCASAQPGEAVGAATLSFQAFTLAEFSGS